MAVMVRGQTLGLEFEWEGADGVTAPRVEGDVGATDPLDR